MVRAFCQITLEFTMRLCGSFRFFWGLQTRKDKSTTT